MEPTSTWEGETISAKIDQTLAGGEGTNQAACGAEFLYSPLSASRVATMNL
ncbi:hypothetical protein F2Q69_00007275 [Brassica cretica]|uniref:Uncharacterized protein n=2 Tax=Brassica cretica TaxID=69181 RepID=A0A8S9P7E8_BRACR|nr:hypothetical protein F2Q69_00007275 [Brassica cretica]KAF3552363.1 hypothetical protein DY000_02008024 [Brassica cretica]